MSKGQDFLDTVIVPALAALDRDTIEARQLLLGTAMQESGLRDIDQIGGGPAQGPFEIEPRTRADVLLWVGARHPVWADAVDQLEGDQQDAAVARLIYERAPGVIGSTPEEQAAYYKQWYNTPLGKATVAEYLANWVVVSEGVIFDQIPLGASKEHPEPLPTAQAGHPAVNLLGATQEHHDLIASLAPAPADLGSVTEPVTEVQDLGEILPTLQPVLEPAPQGAFAPGEAMEQAYLSGFQTTDLGPAPQAEDTQ